MKTATGVRFLMFATLVCCCFTRVSFSEDWKTNEVEFTGTISSVAQNGEGTGTVFVKLQGFDLRVTISSQTDLLDKDGDDTTVADLQAGMRVAVTGKYSSDGILATRVRILDDQSDFKVRGVITATKASGANLIVSLLGVDVTVTPDTKIFSDGVSVPPSTLKTGVLATIAGRVPSGVWTADTVKILSEEDQNKVIFEGTIVSIDTSKNILQVAVTGLTATVTPVQLTTDTKIEGDLVTGAPVLVIGTLNADLSVTASEVRVLPLFEIKPDERKIVVGETASFTVKLRETAAADVMVDLSSSDPTIVELSTPSVKIPKGSLTADFSAKGLKIGSAVITAAALGQKATADVSVGDVSEGENELPNGNSRVAFAPDKITLAPGDTREVVLLVFPPQSSSVAVALTVSNNLIKVAGTSNLGSGTAYLKVAIQAGSQEGSSSVIATLPPELGGGKAELMVTIASKGSSVNQQKLDISFHPGQVKLFVGDSKTVNLMLSQPSDQPLAVALTVVNPAAIAAVPATVSIPVGTKIIKFTVNGIAAGTSTVTAALPSAMGGALTSLSVDVRAKK